MTYENTDTSRYDAVSRDILHEAELISNLDPLELDRHNEDISLINTRLTTNPNEKDLNRLLEIIRRSGDNIIQIMDKDYLVSCAIQRDLGFLTSSLRTVTNSPFEHIPEIEDILIQLGTKTNSVPRDHLVSYCLWNPSGSRRRLFTGTNEEDVFITALNKSYIDLLSVIPVLLSIVESTDNLTSNEFLKKIDFCQQKMLTLVTAMKEVNIALPGVKFTELLKRNFRSMIVGGRSYDSPCGGALPIIVIDYLLYGDDTLSKLEAGDIYKNFVSRFYPYLPLTLQQLIMNKENRSIFSIVMDRGIMEEKQALLEIFNKLIQFRGPHYGSAFKNIQEAQRLNPGKGIYGATALKSIIDINISLRRILEQ